MTTPQHSRRNYYTKPKPGDQEEAKKKLRETLRAWAKMVGVSKNNLDECVEGMMEDVNTFAQIHTIITRLEEFKKHRHTTPYAYDPMEIPEVNDFHHHAEEDIEFLLNELEKYWAGSQRQSHVSTGDGGLL